MEFPADIEERIIQSDYALSECKEKRRALNNEIKQLKAQRDRKTKARFVVQEVAKATQDRLKKRVEPLITAAISSIWKDRDFVFELKFKSTANRIESIPVVLDGKHEQIPKDDMGGGIIDIISFALRVLLWAMDDNRSRPTFALDEPLKNMSKGRYLNRAIQMFKNIAEKMGLQLIIVTHIEEINAIANKIYIIKYCGHKSITELDGVEKAKIKRVK